MRWLREPLVHFLALGALLFGVFALLKKTADAPDEPARIVISSGLQEGLAVSFARNNGRAPTPAELITAIDEYVREEVLCREARALGLDRDDPIVRRRLRQRVEFTAEESASAATPTDAELEQFRAANPAKFRAAPEVPLPPLASVRATVEREWLAARRQRALDAQYATLRARYTVEITPPAAPSSAKP